MAKVDGAPHPDERLESRLEFETLIADLSSRFINLPSADVAPAIEDVQRRICEVLGVDLSALWETASAAEGPLVLTHFHSSHEDLLPPMRGMSAQEYFPWLQREMLAGRTVAVASLDEFPDAAALDRDNLRLFGVKSNLTLPLSVGGAAPVGALGFNTTREERDWPDALVKRLQLVAQVFANALARKRADEALHESEARLALAADSAEAGLWTLDYGTGVFWATHRARAIFGYPPDEVVTMERFEASVHPDDRAFVRAAVERSARAGEPVDIEYRIGSGDEGVRWVASRGRPHHGAAGEPEQLMGISVDVTDRRRDQEALVANEARLRAAADLAGLGFYEVDFVARTVYIDDRFRDLCGVPPEREPGLGALDFWMEHLHPDDRSRVLDARASLHDGSVPLLTLVYRFLHPTEGQRWMQHLGHVAERDATGHTVRAYGVLRDVTERKQAEDELRDLSRRLLRAHEDERALLARELHDDVTQRLAVLAIDVGQAESAAPEAGEAMRAVREGLVRISEDIHALAYQLHPSVLDELGLVEALLAECDRQARQSALDLKVDLDPLPAVVGSDAALCLYRVAQEALNNIVRHAGANTASVTLRSMDGGLVLAVQDDGAGFDPGDPARSRSLGLASMRERVRLVDGTLDVESAPGRGTTVVAWVPTEGGSP